MYFLIRVNASMLCMHTYMQTYINLYILFYESMHLRYACILCSRTLNLYIFCSMSLCIYAMQPYTNLYIFCSMSHPMHMHTAYVINKYIKFHAIYKYMTLMICICNYATMHPYALKKGYYYSYGLILDL